MLRLLPGALLRTGRPGAFRAAALSLLFFLFFFFWGGGGGGLIGQLRGLGWMGLGFRG